MKITQKNSDRKWIQLQQIFNISLFLILSVIKMTKLDFE